MNKLNLMVIALSFLSAPSYADNYIKTLSSSAMNEETFFFSNEIHSDDLYLPVNLTPDRGTLFTDYLSVQADIPDSWRCAEGAIEEQRNYYNGRYFEADYHIRGMWWMMSYSLYYGIERQLDHNPIVSHVSLHH